MHISASSHPTTKRCVSRALQVLSAAQCELPHTVSAPLPLQSARVVVCFAGGEDAATERRSPASASFAPSFRSWVGGLLASADGVAPLLPRVAYQLDEAAAQLRPPARYLHTPGGATVRYDPPAVGAAAGSATLFHVSLQVF